MTATSNDVANQAVELIGDNVPPVTGQSPTWDSSPAGLALQKLYLPAVQTVAREGTWDWQRAQSTLVDTGNVPPVQWAFEYIYPANASRLWQLLPPTIDPNNPLPLNWSVGNTIVSGAQTKVIWTNQGSAMAIYGNSNAPAPGEALWDSLFREAVVRLLASELAMALFGRPDTEASLLQSGASFANIGEEVMD